MTNIRGKTVYVITSAGKFSSSDRLNLIFEVLMQRGFNIEIIDQKRNQRDSEVAYIGNIRVLSLGRQWKGPLQTKVRIVYLLNYYLGLLADRLFYSLSISGYLRNKKDYLLFVGSTVVSSLLLLMNPSLRTKIIVHCFDASLPSREKDIAEKTLNMLESVTYKRVFGVVAEDIVIMNAIERRMGLRTNRLTFLGPVVDTTYWSPRKTDRQTSEFLILFHARIVHRKGIEFLLDALHILIKERKLTNIKVSIVGPGKSEVEDDEDREYISHLRLEADRLGVTDKVDIIFGWQTIDKIRHYYRNCDVYVLPTLMDASPNTVRQGMATGTVVVTTSIGGAGLITNGWDGFTVEPGKARELADVLQRLANNPDLRHRIGQNARKTAVEKFGPSPGAARMERILIEAFKNSILPG